MAAGRRRLSSILAVLLLPLLLPLIGRSQANPLRVDQWDRKLTGERAGPWLGLGIRVRCEQSD